MDEIDRSLPADKRHALESWTVKKKRRGWRHKRPTMGAWLISYFLAVVIVYTSCNLFLVFLFLALYTYSLL